MVYIHNIEAFLGHTDEYLTDKKRYLQQHRGLTGHLTLQAIVNDVMAHLETVERRTHCGVIAEDLRQCRTAEDASRHLTASIQNVENLINAPHADLNEIKDREPLDVTKMSDMDAYAMNFGNIQRYLAQKHDLSEFQSSEAVGTDLDEGDWSRLQQCAVQDAVRCYSYVAEDRGDSIKDVSNALIGFVQDLKDNGGFDDYRSVKRISTSGCLEDR